MNLQQFMPTLIENTCEAFKQSLSSFVDDNPNFNTELLSSNLLVQFSQVLQDASGQACREGLKEFIQSHEEALESVSRCGIDYRYKTTTSKPFLSRFGEIKVCRRTYHHWRGGTGIVPLDEMMGMTGRYMMPDVAEYVLFGAGMLTAKEQESMFQKVNPFKPSASLIQNVINQDGKALDNYLNHPDHVNEARQIGVPGGHISALVASFDGGNLMVREPGLKRGAREKRPGKDKSPNKPIETAYSYRNAMVGAISFYDSIEANNVIDFDTGESVMKPERLSSTYVARMPEERYPAFKGEFERVLSQAEESVPNDVTKILLMDGARGFWKYADENPLYDDYIKVVDYFHAAEHLSRLSEALFGRSSKEGQAWYEKWLSKIKHESGGVASMLRSAKRYQQCRKLSESRLGDLATEVTFFSRNKSRMNYSELVDQGLPIGSGPVEAACKMIVKARFCQSGMRWSLQGGQNVMNLRVIQKSNQWDDTWTRFQQAGGYQKFYENAA